jgi:hypothetical protein
MVQVVVFDNKLQVEIPQERCRGYRGCGVDAQAAVAKRLDKHDVLVADERLIEAHRQAKRPAAVEGEHGYDENVKSFLPAIGVQLQERVGVLGEVMSTVELPEPGDVMHGTVVPVKPKVNHQWVHGELDVEPEERPAYEGLRRLVSVLSHNEHQSSSGARQDEGRDDFADSDVRDAISAMFITVEVAVDMA